MVQRYRRKGSHCSLQIQTIGPKDNEGFRWVKVDDATVYACYWSPNTVHTLFIDFLDRLEGSIRHQEGTVIAAGNFNAKSPVWGDHTEEPKGRALAEMAANLGLTACNKGDKPTFSRIYTAPVEYRGRTSMLRSSTTEAVTW